MAEIEKDIKGSDLDRDILDLNNVRAVRAAVMELEDIYCTEAIAAYYGISIMHGPTPGR